jgi:hypothetical protein
VALIQTQAVTAAGLTPALSAASPSGDQWQPASSTWLYFKNGGSAAVTVTVLTTATIYGQPISNLAIVVGAGSEVMCGPYDPGMVAQPGSNLGSLMYSSAAGLMVAAISSPPA